jgi:hypothetical protein
MSLEATFFEDGWMPSGHDVVVGRLKMATTHSGNLRLNQITLSNLDHYMISSRTRKSQILAEIFDQIQRVNGRFVKLDAKTKKWYEVTKSVARERISQGFRDNLNDHYASSLAHKRKRRLIKNGVLTPDDPTVQLMETLPTSNTTKEKGNKRPRVSALQMLEYSGDMPKAEEAGNPTAEKAALEGQRVDDEKVGIEVLKLNAGQSESPKLISDTNGTSGNSISSEPFLPKDGIVLLDEAFEPQKNDVLVGLRKRSISHPGNVHLVEVVTRFLEEYKKCGNNKSKKSHLLTQVANDLTTHQDPPARFVRLESKHQRWYEVEAFYAREKISQTFRDILQDGYRSASTYKNVKRRKSCTGNQSNNSGKWIIPEEKAKYDSAAAIAVGDDGKGAFEVLRSGKGLPQKDAATANIAVGSPDLLAATVTEPIRTGNTSNGTIKLPVPPTHLSKKRQLEWQIQQLTKQLVELQEGDKDTGTGDITSATLTTLKSSAKDAFDAKESNTGIQHAQSMTDRPLETSHAVQIDPGVQKLTDSEGGHVATSERK